MQNNEAMNTVVELNDQELDQANGGIIWCVLGIAAMTTISVGAYGTAYALSKTFR